MGAVMNIPPEALEAAAIALHEKSQSDAVRDIPSWFYRPWNELDGYEKELARDEARAACLAMIEAWPGMMTACDLRLPDGRLVHIGGAIILPFPPQENPNGNG